MNILEADALRDLFERFLRIKLKQLFTKSHENIYSMHQKTFSFFFSFAKINSKNATFYGYPFI